MVTHTPGQHSAKRRKKFEIKLTPDSTVPQIRLPKCQCSGRPFLSLCLTCGRRTAVTALVSSEPEDEISDSDEESVASDLPDIMLSPATQREAEQQLPLQKVICEDTIQAPGTFPFERLPQELKDAVYEHCTLEHFSPPTKPVPPIWQHTLGRGKFPIYYHLRHVPFPGLLGANKKIRHDYKKIAGQQTTIVFNDHNNFRWAPLELSGVRARQLSEVRHAEFNFDGMCRSSPSGCKVVSDLAHSLAWIKRTVTQFSGLQTVSIRLGIWWSENLRYDYSWPSSPHDNAITDVLERFTAVEHLVKIEVYRKPGQDIDMHLTHAEIEAAMWVMWEKGRGFYRPSLAPGVYCNSEVELQCRGINCERPHVPLQ